MSPVFRHWFIIPLFGCGLLCCIDGTRLLTRRGRNLFDPVPLLGVYGFFFFYVGPLLHVGRDYWFVSRTFAPTDRPDDWRTWLGWMGILNFFGLLIYQACLKRFAEVAISSHKRTAYHLRIGALRLYGLPLLAVTLALQLYIYASFGGLGGFVDAYANANSRQGQGFMGLGWMMCIAESFPILLLIVFVASHRTMFRTLTTLKLSVLLSVVFVLILLFGGLRGSRSNTVISVILAVGIVHAMVHRLSWRFFGVFGALIVAFMYIYGFYKLGPQTFLTALSSPASRAVIEHDSGRTLDAVFLGDLERSDVQAYLLFRIMQVGSQIEYAHGSTYIEAALNFIPRAISSYRPPGKLKYGTNAFFGEGSYSEGRFAATKVYGLAGEAMLNFGPCGIPLAFFALGVVVARLGAFSRRIAPWDSRQYVLPILSLLCCIALSSDFDNVIFSTLEHALMPCLLVWCASSRVALPNRPPFPTTCQEGLAFGRPASR